ncbi:MAG: FHA domain-containing protein, partial [Sandaracinaceae bacterium]|nr:FHA domain-containing protein [Sandaracinaceae bacterium]
MTTEQRAPTHRDTWREESSEPSHYPGVVLAFQVDKPTCHPVPLEEGALTIGRLAPLKLADERVSREHARVSLDGARFLVEDLGSSNGTYVDGERVEGQYASDSPRVLRLGRCVYLFT